MEESTETIDGYVVSVRRHQEDFAREFGLRSGLKYTELAGGMARAIADFLRAFGFACSDLRSLLRIGLYNYAIGNADNHLKNLSIIYGRDWKGIRLAPACDLAPTRATLVSLVRWAWCSARR